MKGKPDIRQGQLAARVLTGSWRESGFPPLDLTEADLDEITPLLCAAGVASLAWRRVSSTPLNQSSSAEVLHQSYRLQSLQAAIQEEKIAKLFRLLRAASVDALLAKGWAAAGFYPDRDLRPLGDIDICVRAKNFNLAQEIIDSPEAADCWVDLHRSFSEIGDRNLEDLFARSGTIELHGEAIRILATEDHLALLCIHMLKHGAWRPLWLCDIAAAVESLPKTFSWSTFMGEDKKRQSWIACAVGLAHQLLAARTSGLPLRPEQLEIPTWLEQTVLGHWASVFPGDHLPIRPAPLMARNLKTGRHIIKGVMERWPDPITATFNLDGRFNDFPRFPYQLADFVLLSMRYLVQLPTKLQSDR